MDDLKLFFDSDKPEPRIVQRLYEDALTFNNNFDLDNTVQVNEKFYVGKQWDGVVSNGLPTPVFNFIKRVVGYIVSIINSDKITVNAMREAAAGISDQEYAQRMVDVVNAEFRSLTERNKIVALAREFSRNAAVDGDACLYTYWDPDVHTGLKVGDTEIMGAIKKEIIENTRVFFGNPQDRHVETQPWIMITSRELIRDAKKRAKENGSPDWDKIVCDEDQRQGRTAPYQTDIQNKVTTFLLLWKDDKTETIWSYECTQTAEIKAPFDTMQHIYPISWMSWDYIQDSYHGQAMVTGLIPNQVSVNRLWAMTILAQTKQAFGKYIYDSTRIQRWDNRVGSAIPINGGDVNSVAKILDPAPINPQVFQLLDLAVTQTEQCLGATSVALGDTRPDNTSAIVALTRAAQTPHEMTKKGLYDAIEQSYRIDLDIMSANYGKRPVLVAPLTREADAYRFIGQEPPETVSIMFDFSVLKAHEFTLRLDVGASTYWSETAAIQTLDNLLMNKCILTSEYLERMPDDVVSMKRELIEAVKQREIAQRLIPGPMQPQMPMGEGEGAMVPEEAMESNGQFNGAAQEEQAVPTGSGNGAMQRAIAKSGQLPTDIM